MIGNMTATPESRGISSAALLRLVKKINKKKIPLHSLLVASGEDIILNAYWDPFTPETLHRMNSVTKSFVGLAIGVLLGEGTISLDDKIIDFFPEAGDYDVNDEVAAQTIEDLLSMRTAYVLVPGRHWVVFKLYDRIKSYFEQKAFKPKQTLFYYDSPASYILCVIVERITGKPFIEFLKEGILNQIGFSKNATCISDAMGYSWGDSGLLCTTEDLYKVGKLINCGGKFNGEQLIDEVFMKSAASFVSSTVETPNDSGGRAAGYGYQIWHDIEGGFSFRGMGSQFMICIPKYDLYVAYTADTQGDDRSKYLITELIEDFIYEDVTLDKLPEDADSYGELKSYCSALRLVSLDNNHISCIAEKVNGREYVLEENPMGIKTFKVLIDGDRGIFSYENGQGKKELKFGLGYNIIGEFPQDGYDYLKIGESPKGYRHPCATSAGWQDDRTLAIRSQMIGTHLGNVYIRLAWNGDKVGVSMVKTAGYFLNEYQGFAFGKEKDV